MIKVLFFAQLKEHLGCGELEIVLAEPIAVKKLKQQLGENNKLWLEAFGKPNLMVAVNQEMANEQTLVKSGDEVAFFPPVTGG